MANNEIGGNNYAKLTFLTACEFDYTQCAQGSEKHL